MLKGLNNIYTIGSTVYIFGRKSDGELLMYKDEVFRPYFYVKDTKGGYVSIFGDKCKKICVSTPYDVVVERSKYDMTFEADVHYPNRYLIDCYDGVLPEIPIRKQWIDLEMVTEQRSLPDIYKVSDPIVSMCIYDSFLDKYVVFAWHPKFRDYELKTLGDVDIIGCSSEEAMFDIFIEFERENMPDILMAWNGSMFDFPYLFRRLGVDRLKYISPIKQAGIDDYGCYIAGMTLLDYLKMYKHVTMSSGSRESYSLDYIGRYELGVSKKEFPSWISKDVWNKRFDELIQYNKRDVEIMVKIDRKLMITDYYNSLRRLTRSRFDDVFMNSVVVDNLLLGLSKGRYVLPTRKKNDKKNFQGAYIKEPVLGLHSWVADMDASSEYPNILITFNISPETISSDGEINIDGVRFKKKPQGIFSEACLYMIDYRNKIREEMKKYSVESEKYKILKTLSTAVKFVTNSIYGYSAYPGSRFYNSDIARVVTYVGREYVKWVEKLAKESGFEFIYADTDSAWIKLTSDNLKDCVKEGKQFQDMVNQRVIEFVSCYGYLRNTLELKFEAIFEKLFFISKKKYFGIKVWESGLECRELEIVGAEAKRSDVPEIGRVFQRELVELILSGKSKEEVDKYIYDFIEKIKKLPYTELGFPCGTKPLEQYKNLPIHIRAMRYSQKHNIDVFYPGEKIKYIYVNGVPKGMENTNVIAFKDSFPEGFSVDYDKVISRIVWMKVEPIYRSLGWSIFNVGKNGVRQCIYDIFI